MNFGVVEVITLLMGLAGFGLGNNPTSPTAEQALEYALPDADLIVHVDVGAVVSNNFKVLSSLPNHPQIKASPELSKAVRRMVAEVEGPTKLIKGMTGIDLATDLSDATAFIQLGPAMTPSYLVQVHGKFKPATFERVANLAGKGAAKIGGGVWIDNGDGNAVGVTKAGVVLAGSTPLVKDRLADAWRAPALTPGSTLGNAAQVLRDKPVIAAVVSMSKTARAAALAELGLKGTNFVTDMIKRHKLWSFSIHRDGIAWSWIDSTKAGLDAMTQFSEGLVDLVRASNSMPRGMAKILLAGLDSYKGTSKQLDELIRRKADLQKLVGSYIGDGNFKVSVNSEPKTLSLNVRLTGKSLGDVMPMMGLLPALGAGAFLADRDRRDEERAP